VGYQIANAAIPGLIGFTVLSLVLVDSPLTPGNVRRFGLLYRGLKTAGGPGNDRLRRVIKLVWGLTAAAYALIALCFMIVLPHQDAVFTRVCNVGVTLFELLSAYRSYRHWEREDDDDPGAGRTVKRALDKLRPRALKPATQRV